MPDKPEMLRIRKSYLDKLEEKLSDLEAKLETAKGISKAKAKRQPGESLDFELDMFGPRTRKWQVIARQRELEWILAMNESAVKDLVTLPLAAIKDRLATLKKK
jgi:hypothetical protein